MKYSVAAVFSIALLAATYFIVIIRSRDGLASAFIQISGLYLIISLFFLLPVVWPLLHSNKSKETGVVSNPKDTSNRQRKGAIKGDRGNLKSEEGQRGTGMN